MLSTESSDDRRSLDKLALALCLGGVVLAILVAMTGRIFGQNTSMMGYGIFVAFQILAVVLGIITRGTAIGKTAAITSSVLLVGSLLFVA